MKADGYLFISYDPDVDGKILLDLDFLTKNWIFQADVIEDWIGQLQELKTTLLKAGDNDD